MILLMIPNLTMSKIQNYKKTIFLRILKIGEDGTFCVISPESMEICKRQRL